jgi:hypothetical protein
MKCFTEELWSMTNSGDMKVFEVAGQRWHENDKEYWSLYPQLQGKLSNKVFDHFKTKGFHDYRLVNVEVKHSEYGILNPVEVVITVTNDSDVWKITFKKIKKLELKFDCG